MEGVARYLVLLQHYLESVISRVRSETQTEAEVLEDVGSVAQTACNMDEQMTLVGIHTDGIIDTYVYTANGLADYFSKLGVQL